MKHSITDPAPVVLLTGARSGIGRALARLLWASSYRVVVTARGDVLNAFRSEAFEDTDRFLMRSLDVTNTEQREALIEELTDRWGGVDILINNAGICYRSVLEHMGEQDVTLQMETNFVGPMALAHLVIPGMREKRFGRIINISSVSGMTAMPTMGYYSASKYALEGASESLWYEMRPWNVQVVLVQPGFINSKAFRRVYYSDAARAAIATEGAYAVYYNEMERLVSFLMTRAHATSERTAKRIYKVMEMKRPHLREPVTIDAHFFGMIRRLLPRRIYHALLYRSLPSVKKWGPDA
ncbi:MAG: NAD(P)-dependent dehydrogenase (short-subunit alcohol dehydrogenase family) [Kiritimatiellia bacterium]|jgi:NAD(P)-dependent dehydrogenase (short-subunit alcohol dehydrogenase family)